MRLLSGVVGTQLIGIMVAWIFTRSAAPLRPISPAVLDSPIGQSGRKGGGKDNEVGYDAGEQVKGRKSYALVDSEGLPMRVVVHSVAIQDRDGAGLVLNKIRRRFPWHELIWADGSYNDWQVDAAVVKAPLLRIEIVKRSDEPQLTMADDEGR